MSEWTTVRNSRHRPSRGLPSNHRGRGREHSNPTNHNGGTSSFESRSSREWRFRGQQNGFITNGPEDAHSQQKPPRDSLANASADKSSPEESEGSSRSASPEPRSYPSLSPYHVSLFVLCPFRDCPSEKPITDSTALVYHLKEAHKLRFINLHHVYMTLIPYLERWAQRIAQIGLENLGATVGKDGMYTIDPDNFPEDKGLREDLQRAKLEEVLQIQSREREVDVQLERRCLFCKNVCQNRATLFRHMFAEHNFNIGLPDNLVNVNEFLNILEQKLSNLQCLYCEKIFTSPAVLRKHMRKKKHFKINARNRIYDRFYVINYLEPGKNWETFENEQYESDEDQRDDSWEDWNEIAEPEQTMCLFCEHVAQSPKEACSHMRDEHGFDLQAIKRAMGLDFYKVIILLNYIRHQTSLTTCMACKAQFDDLPGMIRHMERENCFVKVPSLDDPFWKDPRYLFPTYENDPLLSGFEEGKESSDDDEDETLQIPEGTHVLPEKPTSKTGEDLPKT